MTGRFQINTVGMNEDGLADPVKTNGNGSLEPATTAIAESGASGLTAIAAVADTKHRIYKLVITNSAAGNITISDGFGVVARPANGIIEIDFGEVGYLQDTANTDIDITNDGDGTVSAHGTYKAG